jgi:carnosine N-methyltransferase
MKRSRPNYVIEGSIQATTTSRNNLDTETHESIVTDIDHHTNEGFIPIHFNMTNRPSSASTSHSDVDSSLDLFWNHSISSNDQKEQSYFHDVCNSYRQYSIFAIQQYLNQQFRIQSLPPSQKALLPDSLRPESYANQQRHIEYKEAAIRNQFCLDCILRHAGQPDSQQQTTTSRDRLMSSSEGQISKVSSVLKSLMREWSAEGRSERNMCYIPIINAVKKYISRLQPSNSGDMRKPSRICVPGAGVGRLMCELSSLGYTVQGNEFSLHMLLASDFILNGPIKADQPLQISPWLLETRNIHSSSDQFRTVTIPDRDAIEIISSCVYNPGDMSEEPDFSMAAGDFASVYSTPNEASAWDCVVASFFLDASPCIIEYLQVCHHMLRPGGFLISCGPLLWHWSGPAMMDRTLQEYRNRYHNLDSKYLQSVDFCLDDVKEIMINIGFEIVECSSGHAALYTADRRSMMNTEYQCALLVGRKRGPSVCS